MDPHPGIPQAQTSTTPFISGCHGIADACGYFCAHRPHWASPHVTKFVQQKCLEQVDPIHKKHQFCNPPGATTAKNNNLHCT